MPEPSRDRPGGQTSHCSGKHEKISTTVENGPIAGGPSNERPARPPSPGAAVFAAPASPVPAGEHLAVFRSQDGQAQVLDAHCPHLGANLAAGGRVRGGCIECPFHGWQFRGEDGKCISIPCAAKVPDRARVRGWPSCEVNGMLLVWYHCQGLDPTWAVPEQREITTGEWVFLGQTELLVDTHIQEIPENAADAAHLAFLQGPAVLAGSDLRYTRSRLGDFMKHTWKAEWQPEPNANEHCSHLLLQHSATIFGNGLCLTDLTVSARQVGPGLVYLTFEHAFLGRGVILQTVTPLQPLLQSVRHKIYDQKNVPAIEPKLILRAECVQFEWDVTTWNNKQYLSKPLLVREDSGIRRHRRWFSQFYSEGSVRSLAREEGLDW
ncbi:LOW QUALITY PROTEIN: cholesterol 7-desaturase-like [Empidonax traillii]|uniref:LOW QUALITY PROTEIN: cholesterol 7-desaturase-like n=1 Tax=Empidonax traillii TaxID=164674 RepID=UPI000FFD1E92|nr:LOW QUALITY PROTEIN: cholesterol 7-desaturase-like [Empidonax traillii]